MICNGDEGRGLPARRATGLSKQRISKVTELINLAPLILNSAPRGSEPGSHDHRLGVSFVCLASTLSPGATTEARLDVPE